MVNTYAIGFVCVAAAFAVGTDYVVQAKAHGSYPGEYAFGDYVGAYNARLGETVSAYKTARRQSEAAHVHLPEAPEGWVRREWTEPHADKGEVLAGLPLIEQMALKKELKKAAQVALFDTWDYVRGDEMIRLSARFIGDDSEERGIVALGHLVSESYYGESGPSYAPYAVVQGVPYFEVSGEQAQRGAQLALEAFVGDDILIGVAANAEAETVRAFLERIDYDALNLMLDEPLARIGSNAPPLTEAQEMVIAAQAAEGRYGGAQLAMDIEMAKENIAGQREPEAEPEKPAASVVQLTGGNALGGREADTGVNRLQLSGGRTCLGASTGKFCD